MIEKNLTIQARAFIELIQNITEREKEILVLRFVKRKTLSQVAKRYKLTDSAIKNIEDNVLKKVEIAFDYANLN